MIDASLVQKLIATQFPKWKELSIKPVENGGWDNRTFRLGKDMLVRLPSAAAYASQVEKEHKWLPQLAPKLPLAIPKPLALGKPTQEYPWNWSIYRWIEGTPASSPSSNIALTLADFLKALQQIDATGGPLAGPHSFYRGGSLQIYDAETRRAIEILKDKIDVTKAIALWEAALKTSWNHTPVWIHGDISASNLLTQKGQLIAVIDFGQLTLGDPACDLAIAWTFFKDESRIAFQNCLQLDEGTWLRGKAWALWKTLIEAAGLTEGKVLDTPAVLNALEILKDEKRCFGNGKDFYADYHDCEWGVPVHDDQHLFEMLCLEGAQAGLSWELILKRREGYRKLFHQFEPAVVSEMTDEELEEILKNPSIIRNRRKVFSVRENARIFLAIQKEFGSFDAYVWQFVDNEPIINEWQGKEEVPCTSEVSDQLSKDLKKRGMVFVGTKIIYSFMQAVGMVNDHLLSCPFRRSSQSSKHSGS